MAQSVDWNIPQKNSKLASSWYTSLRYWFLLAVLLVATCLLYAINSSTDLLLYTNKQIYLHGEHRDLIFQTESKYAIKTEGCSIPALNPFDESIIKYVAYPTKLKPCAINNHTLFEQNNTHIWINKEHLSDYKINKKTLLCCYQSIIRSNTVQDIKASKVDDRVTLNKCIYFFDIVEAHDEFVKVTCNIDKKKVVTQYFLFAVKKKKPVQAQNKTIDYNVLILGIDGVSRLNFHRTMPKTLKFLQKKGAVELFGYNKVADNTFPNLVPMLMGITESELKNTCLPGIDSTFDNCPLLWHWYKEAGYYTAFAEDSGWLGTFNYRKRGFLDTPTDYYLHTFMREAEKTVGKNKQSNAYLCMNDHFFYKVLLEYINHLSNMVDDAKLFGLFWEISMSHDYVSYPMKMDEDYEKFFEKLDSSLYLNKTVIFLISDHGIRFGKIRLTKQGRLEERLPFVFILTPLSFREKYSRAFENLKINSRRLTTPFDIHATLLDLIDLKNINNEAIVARASQHYARNRTISLWLKVPSNRTCRTASIEEHWCTCHRGERVDLGSGTALEAGGALVGVLNGLLSGHAACARLRLEAVLEATELVAGGGGGGEAAEWREFQLVVRTQPGGGVFEATLRLRAARWTLSGSVSRLNLYAAQSRCVHDYHLKLYCFCL